MKADDTNENALKDALRGWQVTTPLPPRFQERVWKRIERAEVPGLSPADAVRAWFAMAFARPAFAAAYVSVLLAAGLTLGLLQAGNRAADLDRQLEARYVQLVDPYQRSQ